MSFIQATRVPAQPLWKQLKEEGVRAQDVLNRLGVIEPPIQLEPLCRSLGVELVPVRNTGWSGAIESSDDPPRATCFYDAGDPLVRRRFTIAHELGHLFLDRTGRAFRDAVATPFTESERKANNFAAELLMPEHMVLARSGILGRSPEALARIFQVSVMAMRLRMQNLRLIP